MIYAMNYPNRAWLVITALGWQQLQTASTTSYNDNMLHSSLGFTFIYKIKIILLYLI